MYSSSIISRASMVSTMMNSIQAAKPSITIKFKGEAPETGYQAATPFTTLDTIEGEICIVAPAETRFDNIQISFEGTSRVWMERYGAAPTTLYQVHALRTVSGSTMGSTCENTRSPFLTARQFLRLNQPVEESSMPLPRVFEKGRNYTFPFMFIVPDRLLPTQCSHRYKNNLVQEAHLRLPPSLGDGTSPMIGGCTLDDIAPNMTKISYSIHVRIVKKRDSDNKMVTVSDNLRKVRIIPSYEDLPPTMVDENDKDYVLRKEKDIRKGFLKGRLGKLAVEAQEPKALHITPTPNVCPPTTMIPVTLTFTPATENCEPPTLSSLYARLRAVTMFSTQPISYFPTKSSVAMDPTLGVYHETALLSSRCLAGVQWAKNESLAGPFYTTNIQVPAAQPKCKALVPTFYSCLAARTYSIELNLSVNASGTFGANPSITLKVPVQVSSRPASCPSSLATSGARGLEPAQRTMSSSNHSDAEEEEEDGESYTAEFFRPRSIAPPSTMYIPLSSDSSDSQLPAHMRIHRSNLPPPPGYSHLAGSSMGVPARVPSPVGVASECG